MIYEERMKNTWGEKFKVEREITKQEWALLKKVNAAQTEWEHLFAVKYSAGILPTKVNMVRRKHEVDPKCPCCDIEERTEHILQCQAISQQETFDSEIDELGNFLTNVTSWEIRGAILSLLKAFRNQNEPAIHHNWSDNVVTIIRLQYGLGQKAFVSGLWTEEWIVEQNKFNKTLKSRKHGITTLVQTIKAVQKAVREMWYRRNDELHSNEESRSNKMKSEEYDKSIDSLFRQKRELPIRFLAQADRKYFSRRIQAIKKMRNARKEQWIRDAEAVLNKYNTENESEQVRAFRSYFMHRDDG